MTIQLDKHGTSCFQYEQDLRFGNIPNRIAVGKFGLNRDIDTATKETVRAYGGLFTSPISAAEKLKIKSTDANDDLGSTGAQVIQVEGVASGWIATTELVNLDGTNEVTTANDWIGVNGVVVYLAGSSLYNEGTLSGFTETGSVQLFSVESGANITQQCIYYVPLNYEAYVDRLFLNAAKLAGGSTPVVTFRLETYIDLTSAAYTYFENKMDVGVKNTETVDLRYTGAIPEKSVVQITAETDTNNTFCFATMDMTVTTSA